MQWQGDYGPFFPQIAAQVPLWLAVALKKRGKCTIRPPLWMSVGELLLYLCVPISICLFPTHIPPLIYTCTIN
jgi:hypothetical protein